MRDVSFSATSLKILCASANLYSRYRSRPRSSRSLRRLPRQREHVALLDDLPRTRGVAGSRLLGSPEGLERLVILAELFKRPAKTILKNRRLRRVRPCLERLPVGGNGLGVAAAVEASVGYRGHSVTRAWRIGRGAHKRADHRSAFVERLGLRKQEPAKGVADAPLRLRRQAALERCAEKLLVVEVYARRGESPLARVGAACGNGAPYILGALPVAGCSHKPRREHLGIFVDNFSWGVLYNLERLGRALL